MHRRVTHDFLFLFYFVLHEAFESFSSFLLYTFDFFYLVLAWACPAQEIDELRYAVLDETYVFLHHEQFSSI